MDLISLIGSHSTQFFVTHICSHSNLSCPLPEGNTPADNGSHSNHTFTAASESHAYFHQNASALSKDYGISVSQARMINACPDCQCFSSPNVPAGIVHRGLTACQLWQTDCCVPLWGTVRSSFKNR